MHQHTYGDPGNVQDIVTYGLILTGLFDVCKARLLRIALLGSGTVTSEVRKRLSIVSAGMFRFTQVNSVNFQPHPNSIYHFGRVQGFHNSCHEWPIMHTLSRTIERTDVLQDRFGQRVAARARHTVIHLVESAQYGFILPGRRLSAVAGGGVLDVLRGILWSTPAYAGTHSSI